jgi:hypothetical protein
VPQHMDCHARQARAPACARQHAGQADEMAFPASSRKDETRRPASRKRIKQRDRGRADRP